jgi:hypothetical protein
MSDYHDALFFLSLQSTIHPSRSNTMERQVALRDNQKMRSIIMKYHPLGDHLISLRSEKKKNGRHLTEVLCNWSGPALGKDRLSSRDIIGA